jgi:hypothetical protein
MNIFPRGLIGSIFLFFESICRDLGIYREREPCTTYRPEKRGQNGTHPRMKGCDYSQGKKSNQIIGLFSRFGIFYPYQRIKNKNKPDKKTRYPLFRQ